MHQSEIKNIYISFHGAGNCCLSKFGIVVIDDGGMGAREPLLCNNMSYYGCTQL